MTTDYYQALIVAYEDEVGGVAYFKALTHVFVNPELIGKLGILVDLETQTSEALATLIKKYDLTPQPKEHIKNKSFLEAKQRANGKTWRELLEYFAKEFPPYIDEFKECLALAPAEDKPILQQTVEHEEALVEFVKLELANSANSLDDINAHIRKYST